jgi:hypothetical protein
VLRNNVVGVALGAALVAAPAASADGLPALGMGGPTNGIASLRGDLRYKAQPAGHVTRIERRSADGHRLLGTGMLLGRFDIPVVAFDGSPSGLSGDGRTLVLIRPRTTFPQAHTSLAVVDTGGLRVRKYLRLRGDFSFDAISPNGRWIYFINYLSRADPTKYRVRAFDVQSGRLLAQPIVDPRERGPAMHGTPLSRATSADGAWAYTLYDGGSGHPFVHALDTTHHRAVCVDLPAPGAGTDPSAARLAVSGDGRTLHVSMGQAIGSAIDTRTFRVTNEAPAAGLPTPARPGASAAPSTRLAQQGDDGISGYVVPVAAIVLLAAGALVWWRRRDLAAYVSSLSR